MNKKLAVVSILGGLTIMLGAFGAHALEKILTIHELKSFETAVSYQMYHVLVLLFVNLYNGFNVKEIKILNSLFFLGILFFSGSIYLITLGVSSKSIWFLTPLGGLFLIFGWFRMAIYLLKKR